jgi:hypothetical protein
MAGQVELRVAPSVEGLDKGHPALEAAADEFYDNLRQLSGIKVQERDVGTTQFGFKGVLQHLVLMPDGPAAAWATVKMAKLWLSRDRQRSLTVTIDCPGQEPRTITASGDIVSAEALERAIHDAFGADADYPKSKKKH